MKHSKQTDGGTNSVDGESPFETIADAGESESNRYRRTIDEYAIAPLRIIWSDWRARVGISILLLYVLMGTIGIVLVDQPVANEGPRLLKPFQDWTYPLGTDGLGRGLFKQIIHATPAMLKMILSGAVFATMMATALGVYSGYKGGVQDRIIMTFTDMVMTIPGLPLIIILAAIFEPRDPLVVGFILAIHRWAGFARSLRAQTLTLRQESYVEASRVLGVSRSRIIRKEILPNLMPLVAVYFMNTARGIIFASVGLYFLGILPFTSLNWGVILNMAYSTGGSLYTLETAHWFLVPMITIALFSLGLILFAQGADRLFNPRIRARHADTQQNDSAGPLEN